MSTKTCRRLTCIAVAMLLGSPVYAGKIIHRVSVGGSDMDLGPDAHDANYSLIALMDDAGKVSGQYDDQFADGTGVHADVTELAVYPTGVAVIGGVIKNSTTSLAGYQVGSHVCTIVLDDDVNGDKISYTYSASFAACNGVNPFLYVRPIRSGQVKVR